MTTPAYAELVAAVRREGETLGAAGRLGLDAAVPPCPGWTVADLLRHTGRIYRHVAGILTSRATDAPTFASRPGEVDPVDYLRDGLDALVAALTDTDPETPVWNWSREPGRAAFWARRMAHESLVHRVDVELAHDVTPVVEVDLAVDGIDELLDVLAPRVLTRQQVDGLEGTLHVVAPDTGAEWSAKLTPDSVSVTRGSGAGDVSVSGRPSELLLLLYNRGDGDGCEITGDRTLLDRWKAGIQV